VGTPPRPLPQDSFPDFAPAPTAQDVIDPDDPPWGVGMAMLVWVSSMLLMIFIPLLAVIPYLIIRYRGSDFQQLGQSIATDPNALLITLVATLPTHAVTVAIIWALVTGFGKRPFWRTIGWNWGESFGFWSSVAVAILLLVAGGLVAYYLGGEKTPFDQMLESSAAARFTTAALATLTAPLVEEMVFRGVLYPAIMRGIERLVVLFRALAAPVGALHAGGATVSAQGAVAGLLNRAALSVLTFFGALDARQGGMAWSIIIVSMLFLSVHVPQYNNNPGVLVAVGMLSLALTTVRALTKRLLPCFIIHLVFNGVQVVELIREYFVPGSPAGDTKAGLLALAHAPLHFLF
jgi:membrane protease YdiL (CAAX protease family)